MTVKVNSEFGSWNPGIESDIPRRLLPCATIFDAKNVSTDYSDTLALSELTGLAPHKLSKFRVKRLVVHELLIRVTCDLSVADGPEYEALGLSLRGMVHKLFKNHFEEELEIFQNEHDKLISTAWKTMLQLLDCEPAVEEQPVSLAWYKRLFSPGTKSKIPGSMGVEDHGTIIDRKIECAIADEDYLMRACGRALQTIINAFRGKQG
ncbi:MAG: hypothetical protein AAF217_15535, partial [Pseudomonadota bacterium]